MDTITELIFSYQISIGMEIFHHGHDTMDTITESIFSYQISIGMQIFHRGMIQWNEWTQM